MSIRFLDIRGISAEDEALVARFLPERYARALRYRQHADALRCIGAGLLLIRLGLRDEASLAEGPYGKPSSPCLPAFNISHSGDIVMLAYGSRPVGVDIEVLDERNLDVARSVFTPRELGWMRASGGQGLRRFYWLWTRKEAVMKALGLGLALPPRDFEVLIEADGAPLVVRGCELDCVSVILDGYVYSAASIRPPAGEVAAP